MQIKFLTVVITWLLVLTSSAIAERISKSLGTITKELSVSECSFGNDFKKISLPDQNGSTGKLGFPDLPKKTLTFFLPQNAKNITAAFRDGYFRWLLEPVLVMPHQDPIPLNGDTGALWRPPDSAAYASTDAYPGKVAAISGISARGEFIQVSVDLFPVHYRPASRQLGLLSGGTLVVEYDLKTGVDPLRPGRSDRSAADWNAFVSKSSDGPVPEAPKKSSSPDNASLPGGHVFRSLIGSLPRESFDYLIITSSALAGSYEPLARWRTRRGLRTVIQTVEWIGANAPGADLPERVRNYIKACWLYCGAGYVLLGGDADIIPVRQVHYMDYWVPGNLVPSDIYYSDIVDTSFASGFWGYGYNANNNLRFGELPGNCGQDDGVDQTPDIFLGRAPVSDAAQARAFVAKVLAYEQNPPPGFAESALLLADGNFAWFTEQADQILASAAPWVQSREMYNPVSGGYYSGDELLTPANAVARLGQGFHVVYHFDHGGIYSLAMARDHSSAGGGWIYRPSVDALANAGRASIVITPACSPNAFDYSSISESFLNNPMGGAAAFIGNTRVGWTSQYPQFNRFFQALYGQGIHSLGSVFAEMLSAGNEYGRYSLNLLGDPAMQVYTREPLPLQAIHPTKLEAGDSLLRVEVAAAGYGQSQVLVCLSSDGKLLASSLISAPGAAAFGPASLAAGFVEITVTAANHMPYMDSCFVPASLVSPPLYSGFDLNDGIPDRPDGSAGNGDFTANPGETVAIYPRLGPGVIEARLSSMDQSVAVMDSVVSFPPFSGSGYAPGRGRFLAAVSPSPVSSRRVWLSLAVRLADAPDPRLYPLALDIAADSLGLVSAAYRMALSPSDRETVLAIDSVRLGNFGAGAARGLRLWLSVDSSSAGAHLLFQDTLALGGLAPGMATAPLGPFAVMCHNDSLGSLAVSLVAEDAYGRRSLFPLEASGMPDRPYSLAATPLSDREVKLQWYAPDAGIAGYNVYRRLPGDPGYARINSLPVSQRIYIDICAGPMAGFRYAVASLGANGRESPLSEEAAASPCPPKRPGFPKQLDIGNTGTRIWGAPASGDLNGDGCQELVLGCDDGLVYVFDHQGNPLPGWPKDLGNNQYGSRIAVENSSPALADLDGDGRLDIIMGNGPWYGDVGDGLVHAWRHDGSELPGWPQPVYGDAFAPAAVADLDGDGLSEVVAVTNLGMVYLWDRGGNLLPGWPVSAGSVRIMAGAAVGNLDGDQEKEIVVAANDGGQLKLWALKIDGSSLPGWPKVLQTGAVHVLSSPALADLDGDGQLEIVVAAERDPSGVAYVHCLRGDGTYLDGWPFALSFAATLSSPALGDLNGDGRPDIALVSGDGMLYSISHDNGPIINWSKEVPTNGRGSPAIADVDGDGSPDVLVASEDGFLRSFCGSSGTATAGFPMWIEPSWSAPLVSDLDGNGKLELAAFGWGSHRLHVWDLASADLPSAVVWGRLGCDQGRTGCLPAGADDAPGLAAAPAAGGAGTELADLLEQCRPNPSRGHVGIRYQLSRPGRVDLKVYNLLGQAVRTLVSGHQPAGRHHVVWDRRDASGDLSASGTYFYRIVAGDFQETKRAVIVE